MSNSLRQINRNQVKAMGGLVGRTFEKTQGCWNCIHFENGAKAKAYWKDVCRPRDVANAKVAEVQGNPALAREVRATIKAADAAVAQGALGMCMAGKANSDFVVHNFLCDDGWTGKQGASVAREGAAPDLTPGEIREIVDAEDKKNGGPG